MICSLGWEWWTQCLQTSISIDHNSLTSSSLSWNDGVERSFMYAHIGFLIAVSPSWFAGFGLIPNRHT
jgi:hypothetical protein